MALISIASPRERRTGRLFGPLGLLPACVLVFFLLPLGSLATIAVSGGWDALPRASIIGGALRETSLLLVGTSLVCLLVAVPLAWAVSRYDFPLRRTIEIVSVLPLALPAYLAAYAYVSLSDFFGPLQTGLRALSGADALPWFPDLRSMAGACFIMGITLFPYVYLPARWSFERQSARQIEAARNLGASPRDLLFRIALPLAWPAIVAGLSLAMLETLNDIGATQYLGVNSLTVLTFNTWSMRENLGGAAQLALLLLIAVAALIVLERRFRKARRYADPSRQSTQTERLAVPGVRGVLLAGLCALPFLLGFLAPAFELAMRSLADLSHHGLRPEVRSALLNTLLFAGLATALIILIGFALALLKRLEDGVFQHGAVDLSILGYGVPGLILVVGLLPLAGFVDRTLFAWGVIPVALVSGSSGLLIAAYALRFTAIATGQAEAAMKRLTRNVDHAAATLGASRMQVARRVLTPQLLPVAGAAGILIAVDCIKELPATLILRPMNVETLSTLVYEAASRGVFEEGAVAAMLIVLVGLLPLTLLFRLISRGG